MDQATHDAPPGDAIWLAAQIGGLIVLVLVMVGLVVVPLETRILFWYAVIPLVPLSLMVSPMIWRNVCPLATLNVVGGGRRTLHNASLPAAGFWGLALLIVLIAARRLIFDQNGPALEVLIALIGLGALVGGAFFSVKVGLCNSLCPVLPVERFYGQHPLISIGNPRCRPCTLCTERGCIDLSPALSMPQSLGKARRSRAWLFTSLGIFAAAFPGFIVGWGTTTDVPFMTAGNVLVRLAAWSLGSYLVVSLAVVLTRASSRPATTFLAGLCAGLYYWFAAPPFAWAVGLPRSGFMFRMAFLAFVAAWSVRAFSRLRRYRRPTRTAS